MSIFLFTLMVIGFTNALEFPTAYYAEGAIYLPYGDIAEPFSAWVDMDTGNSRFDSYNGECMASQHYRKVHILAALLTYLLVSNGFWCIL